MGETYCSFCGGSGFDRDGSICPHCNGSGYEPLDIPESEQD